MRKRREDSEHGPDDSKLPVSEDLPHSGVDQNQPSHTFRMRVGEHVQDRRSQARADHHDGRIRLDRVQHRGQVAGQPLERPTPTIVVAAAIAGTIVRERACPLSYAPLHCDPHRCTSPDAGLEHDQRVAVAGEHAAQNPPVGQAQLLFL